MSGCTLGLFGSCCGRGPGASCVSLARCVRLCRLGLTHSTSSDVLEFQSLVLLIRTGPAAEEWELLPSSPALLHSHYLGLDGKSVPRLQKAVSAAISRERKRIFMLSCGDDVSTRISSCALPSASDWLNDVRSAMDMYV